jgi:serine/threonine-protein kinase
MSTTADRDRLESYKADLRSAVVLIEKIARAIHHAHTRSRGVLHLDLKPGNILLTADGEPKVTDFGLSVRCRMIDRPAPGSVADCPGGSDAPDDVSATIARAGIVGTIQYMSPEMAGGRWSDVSTASDVYGLGAILYTTLTGQPPFRGRDARETLAMVVQGNLTSPCELNRKVDRELNAVCLKCLHRDPKERYGSADALANDLRRWLERRPTLAGGKPSVGRESQFWARRHPLGLALTGVAAVALWLTGLAISLSESRAENARDAARLASDVDRDLNLIRHAAQLWASDPRLQFAFTSPPVGPRQRAIEAFLTAAVEKENLFGIAGRNPLINVFVLDPEGTLLADTMRRSPYIGKSYRVRDYYRALLEHEGPADRAYVARSFLSTKDAHYKIAISTRIWDSGGKLLGILVANVPIGPRLIDVDMGSKQLDSAILCPMDRSDPSRETPDLERPWAYISVLDGHYTEDAKNSPFPIDPPRLLDFQDYPRRDRATAGPWGGQVVDYHRVGETPMIVVMRRKCPWPLSWLSFR